MALSPVTLYVGRREDLIRFFEEAPPPLQTLGALLENPEHPAANLRIVNRSSPGENASHVAISLDPENRLLNLSEMEPYGCLEESFAVGAIFYATVHEIAHLMNGIMGQKLGLARSLTSYPASLVPILFEEEAEGRGTSEPGWNLSEYLPEILSRALLCHHLTDENLPWLPGDGSGMVLDDSRTYTPPLPGEPWSRRLTEAIELFLDSDGITPEPFVSSEVP